MKYEKNQIVGDWVTSEKGNTSSLFVPGTVGCICRLDNSGDYWVTPHTSTTTSMKELCIGDDGFRPATQEEINKATQEEKIMWGQFQVHFKGDDNCRDGKTHALGIGCVNVSRELWNKTAKKAGWL